MYTSTMTEQELPNIKQLMEGLRFNQKAIERKKSEEALERETVTSQTIRKKQELLLEDLSEFGITQMIESVTGPIYPSFNDLLKEKPVRGWKAYLSYSIEQPQIDWDPYLCIRGYEFLNPPGLSLLNAMQLRYDGARLLIAGRWVVYDQRPTIYDKKALKEIGMALAEAFTFSKKR